MGYSVFYVKTNGWHNIKKPKHTKLFFWCIWKKKIFDSWFIPKNVADLNQVILIKCILIKKNV